MEEETLEEDNFIKLIKEYWELPKIRFFAYLTLTAVVFYVIGFMFGQYFTNKTWVAFFEAYKLSLSSKGLIPSIFS